MEPKFKFFSSRLLKVLVIISIAGVLIFFNPYEIFNPLHAGLSRVVYPFQKFFYGLSFKLSEIGSFLGSVGEMKDENERLLKENQKLLSQNALLRDMDRENRFLREQLELLPRGRFDLEAAFVIGRDSLGPGNWIEISKGKKHGIKKGMPVIVSNGILIGRIGEVYGETSQVILVTNPESLINSVDSQTEAKGVVRGEYGLGIIFDRILQADVINLGDEIVTSGASENVPGGLLIGNVQEVGASSGGLFQRATISSPVSFSKLETIFVIKGEK